MADTIAARLALGDAGCLADERHVPTFTRAVAPRDGRPTSEGSDGGLLSPDHRQPLGSVPREPSAHRTCAKHELISSNPAARFGRYFNTRHDAREHVQVLEPDHVAQVLRAAVKWHPDHELAVRTLFDTGMREGELLASSGRTLTGLGT